MVDTSEKSFESYIEDHLLEKGYVKRLSKDYDKTLGLDTESLFQFIYNTQSKEWNKFKDQYGKDAKQRFLQRFTKGLWIF